MTNSEKQMAEELYGLVEEGTRFSQWEMNFIGRLAHLPWHHHLSCRQREVLESLWKEHIGLPDFRPCVFPLMSPPRKHFVIHNHNAPEPVIANPIGDLKQKIRELESAIDRLTSGQSYLFRDVENIEHTIVELNDRIIAMETSGGHNESHS